MELPRRSDPGQSRRSCSTPAPKLLRRIVPPEEVYKLYLRSYAPPTAKNSYHAQSEMSIRFRSLSGFCVLKTTIMVTINLQGVQMLKWKVLLALFTVCFSAL